MQRALRMVVQTFTGSALTRTAFPGAPELYRDLAAGVNPVFYVSSSPWNLHAFLLAFLRHRDFPLGPVLLRDLLGTRAGREQKHERIREILDLHPDLSVRAPRRLRREGPADLRRHRARATRTGSSRSTSARCGSTRATGGWRRCPDAWDSDVPFVLAADSDAVRRHATGLGLL